MVLAIEAKVVPVRFVRTAGGHDVCAGRLSVNSYADASR
jgi:hypothetical protein